MMGKNRVSFLLSNFLALNMVVGAGSFIFSLRRFLYDAPIFIIYICTALILSIIVSIASFNRALKTDWLSSRNQIILVVFCIFTSLVVAILVSLLQVKIFMEITKLLQMNSLKFEEMRIASSLLLAPNFFATLHAFLCVSFGLSGLRLRFQYVSIAGVFFSLPTLYFLINYASV
jgi:hypothetical protein